MDDYDEHSDDMLIQIKTKEECKMNNQNEWMKMRSIIRIKEREPSHMFLKKRWKQKKRCTSTK